MVKFTKEELKDIIITYKEFVKMAKIEEREDIYDEHHKIVLKCL